MDNVAGNTRQDLFEIAMNDTKQETYANEFGGMQSNIGVDMTLLPLDGLLRAAAIMTSNAKDYGGKYPRNNWRDITLRDQISHAYLHVAKAGQLLDKVEHYTTQGNKNRDEGNDFVAESYYAAAEQLREQVVQEMAHAACRTLFATSDLNV